MAKYQTSPEFEALKTKFSDMCKMLASDRLSLVTWSAVCIFQGHPDNTEVLDKVIHSKWDDLIEQEFFDTALAMFRMNLKLNPHLYTENENVGEN